MALWVSACSNLTMLHVSHPYLVSLSFYTIPICLFLGIFNLLVYVDRNCVEETFHEHAM